MNEQTILVQPLVNAQRAELVVAARDTLPRLGRNHKLDADAVAAGIAARAD
jgi:hypothetical protein